MEQYIRVCPKCKSPDVSIDKSNPAQARLGFPSSYVCNKCDYMGVTFPEVLLSEMEDFQEEAGKHELPEMTSEKFDTSYGKFGVSIIWKITAPLLLVAGVFVLMRQLIPGAILTVLGLGMTYVTYLK